MSRSDQSHRPAFHFSPPANWLSDPNGLFWNDGLWHLYYQHNPHGEDWGFMSWGHATSPDLVSWTNCDPAILYNDRHAIFSGCAFLDRTGRAGFGENAVIAAYTAASNSKDHQAQHLAYSRDGGFSFEEISENPILDLGLADFRDPNIFWYQGSHAWIMVVARSTENRASLYASTDLCSWRHLSDVGPWGAPGRTWECPMLIELPVEGGGMRWLFKVDVLEEGPGSGAIAVSGHFDGATFNPDAGSGGAVDWRAVDIGRDFYAAVPWHENRDGRGRPCWIGWTGNHAYQKSLPPRGWRGTMSLPKRLSFRSGTDGYSLIQTVEPSVFNLLANAETIVAPVSRLDLPLSSRIRIPARDHSLTLTLSQPAGETLKIFFGAGIVTIDRSADLHPDYDLPVSAELNDLPVTLWLDQGVLEMEWCDGQHWLTMQHGLFAKTVEFTLDSVEPIEVEFAFVPRLCRCGDVEGDSEPLAIANACR